MRKIVSDILSKIKPKGNYKVFLLVSICNTIILLLLTYILNNQPLFTGEDLNQYAWTEYIKEKLGLSEHIDYKDALFINVSYDKQLVEKHDDFGMPVGNIDITDRAKLLALLNTLDKQKQYRYIILDVRFEKGFNSESDSALFDKIKSMDRIVIAGHSNMELADSTLSVKAAISDYSSTIVATNFTRYKFTYDNKLSIPLYAYKDMTNKTITKHGLFYSCDGRLCYNSVFLRFPTDGFSEYDENNNKTFYNLGGEILENYTEADLATLSKGKLVFIGDMVEDVHDTYSGLKPGNIITYHSLQSLLSGEHFVSYKLLFFLAIVFFLISLSLFREVSITEKIPFIKRSRSKLLHFIASLIGYGFVLFVIVVVLYLFFDITISIILPSIYFSVQRLIISYKRMKI